MSGNILLDMVFWFFALAGFTVLLCDVIHFLMYKDALPEKMTVLLSAEQLKTDSRTRVANLINVLYEQNTDGNYEFIIIGSEQDESLLEELRRIADATDCVYVADANSVAAYIKSEY